MCFLIFVVSFVSKQVTNEKISVVSGCKGIDNAIEGYIRKPNKISSIPRCNVWTEKWKKNSEKNKWERSSEQNNNYKGVEK